MRDDDVRDPDRAAILARRQRFIALALTGLSTTACKHSEPAVCLSMVQPDPEPEQPPPDQPIVEDSGAPVESPPPDDAPAPEPAPEPCLKVRPR